MGGTIPVGTIPLRSSLISVGMSSIALAKEEWRQGLIGERRAFGEGEVSPGIVETTAGKLEDSASALPVLTS